MKGIKIRSVAKARSVYELLGNPIRWIRSTLFGKRLMDCINDYPQNEWAYSAYHKVSTLKKEPDCFCIIGAITKVYPNVRERHEAIRRVAEVIGIKGKKISEVTDGVIIWNDNTSRTWQDIRNVAKAAHI